MYTISSNGSSHDQQVLDALEWLHVNDVEAYTRIKKNFPENIIFGRNSSWFDTEAMGVDAEWSSWLCDAIEAESVVFWEEGEPWVLEANDLCKFCHCFLDEDGADETGGDCCDGDDDGNNENQVHVKNNEEG